MAAAAPADPGTAYRLLLSCTAGLPRSRVSVRLDHSFDRIPHPDPTLERSIDEVWNQQLASNPSLFNGTKFRYAGHSFHCIDGSNEEYSVSLHLGLTDYRTFVGTNLNSLWEKFLVPSEDDSVCCQHTSDPLGNAAIVETSDEKIIILQRSYNVVDFPGYCVFPGGHSEPEEVGISGHQTDNTDIGHLNKKVSQEMFDGIIREVVEETGVPADSLTDPVLIGVSRREMNVRPAAFFFMKCNIDSSDVCELYSKAQDGYESTKLYVVSVNELRGMSQRMTGCHRGGFALYESMKNAAKHKLLRTVPSKLIAYEPNKAAALRGRSTEHRGARMAASASAAAPADPGNAYRLLLSCPSGLPPSCVSVRFGPAFDRIPHPDAALEESVGEIWNQRLQQNPSLYSGTKFRYGGHTSHSHRKDEENQEHCVSLHLGLTDYRTFVGTNLNPLWEKFLVPSKDDSVYCQHMSNPLGNGAIVETSDGKIVVLQRSYNVGEFPGYYVFPGGHSEPQEIGILAHQTDEDLARLNERVSQEMFDGITREVVEETGVPASSLTEPVFIGVSRREMNVRPTAFFFTRCNIDSTTVAELYSRAQDGYESIKLYTVSAEELRGMSQRMPGCHHGGLALYELMRSAAENRQT